LAGRLGRFASLLTGAHVSDTSPKSTNRDDGAKPRAHVSYVHLSMKGHFYEQRNREVV
jgi:hypothetical protein